MESEKKSGMQGDFDLIAITLVALVLLGIILYITIR